MESERKKAWERYIQLMYKKYYGSEEFLKEEMLADDTEAKYGN